MNPDRLTRMESLIEQALALAPEKRERFLQQECGDDEALRNELKSLLEDSDTAFQFIQGLADNLVTPALSDLDSEQSIPSEPDQRELIGTSISHYQIEDILGSGGMGVVYKAFDTRLDRTVALKFLPPSVTLTNNSKQRFIREAKAAASINHPNICHIHSIGEYQGQHFIDMEYVQGRTLREEISEGPLSLDKTIDYAGQILDALCAAHEKSIVHRDIKPENIMVDSNHRIKVMDFGLAKLKGSVNLTAEGRMAGTVAYMSPEQIQGEEVDQRSEIFSFGVVLYEMLTGQRPFKGQHQAAMFYSVLNENPVPPSLIRPEIPAELDELVEKCLEKDPAHRYTSAGEILISLKKDWASDAHRTSLSTGRKSDAGESGKSNFQQFGRIFKSAAALIILLIAIGSLTYYTFSSGSIFQESIPADRHIVVLPFNNLSEESIPASLNDGILEFLTSKLTQMEVYQGSLWVVPSSEVRYQQVTSVSEASRLFGANLAVTGSLKRDGDRFLLTLSLVDGNSLRNLRSNDLETAWTDFASIQNQIIDALVDLLEIELATDAFNTIRAGSSMSSAAYQLYIEGLGYLSRYEDLENVETSIRFFQESVQSDTTFARAYSKLAEAYWRKFEITQDPQWTQHAIGYGQKAVELNSRIPDVYLTKALIYNGMGRHDEALEILDDLANNYRPNFSAHLQRARAYEGKGLIEQAEEAYRDAIDQKSTYWDGYNSLGVFYYHHGLLDEAADMFRKVTELTPDNHRAFNNLGGVYFAMNNFENAVETFERSLEIRLNHTALSNLGTLYFYKRNYDEAIRYYEKAIEMVDRDYRMWGYLGFSYHRSGKDSEKVRSAMNNAIQLAEQVRKIRPNDDVLLSQLAGYYLTVEDQQSTRKLLNQLNALDVLQPETYASIAHLYEQLGERDTSIKWVEESLRQGYRLQTLEYLEGMQDLLKDPRISELREKHD